ncbi:tetratricopeptide repeat protein [Roseivirga thermotolerans]|uniref:MalT-like TPR region domain-containing protein n=1 Tax=Roseivirga thermotolerans TaxID=1758176 RepID=A0ABQ3I513_9BACT|nr:tetratricopeptide repeat protein [Roseivirga thermotolerans]GHE65068.1 hypothetical protein GCM10011340_20130 [Roseivirga thermotolerans]
MKKLLTIVAISLLILSCSKTSEKDLAIDLRVKEIVKVSARLDAAGKYDSALINTVDAIALLKTMDAPDNRRIYRYYRNQAKMAEMIKKPRLAVICADSALVYLNKTRKSEIDDWELEEFGLLKFKAMYLRLAGEYQKSTDITLELLKKAENEEKFAQYRIQLVNQLGLAYYELGDQDKAQTYFLDLLKNPTIPNLDMAFYYKNLARSYARQGNEISARDMLNHAMATMPKDEKNAIYYFDLLNEATAMYVAWELPAEALRVANEALEHYQLIESSPQLYSLYRHKANAHFALGQLQAGNESNRIFDSLEQQHKFKSALVDEKFELSMLMAKTENYKLQKQMTSVVTTRNFWFKWGLIAIVVVLSALLIREVVSNFRASQIQQKARM